MAEQRLCVGLLALLLFGFGLLAVAGSLAFSGDADMVEYAAAAALAVPGFASSLIALFGWRRGARAAVVNPRTVSHCW